jgi:NitT/TauT family transport system substrate-binding protein
VKTIKSNTLAAVVGVTLVIAAQLQAGEKIRVSIGTQDTTINCAAGGPVVRELHLLEKYLPHDGKYKDAEYQIQWLNLPTGAQLNTEVLANRLDIVQMADFPATVGHSSFLASKSGVKTLYIASLSVGVHGAGNALLVPKDSPVQSIKDLKGKRISVPAASTAHAFLLRAIQAQGWDPEKDVTITVQTPEVGGSALKANQIDAHADFVPFGELFPFRGFARKILDGESTGLTTTHGLQVRSDYAQKYPEVVIAYLKATLEADRLLRENPEQLAEQYEKWTGIEAEVFYAFHGPGGIQTRDYTLKPEVIEALRNASQTLKVLKKTAVDVNVDEFVDDHFIKQAAQEFGLDYEARLRNYAPVPFTGDALDTGRPITEPNLVGQIWVRGEAKVRLYSSPEATLQAADQLKAEGKQLRVVFVHDRTSGIKLFADKVWYVHRDGKLAAFLLRESADAWAAQNGGQVLAYTDASDLFRKSNQAGLGSPVPKSAI